MTRPVAGSSVLADPALVERVRAGLAASGAAPTPAQVAGLLRRERGVLGDATVLAVTDALRAEISGAGPLEALLRRPGTTDVLVNGSGQVWVDRGCGLERSPVRIGDESAVRRLAQRLAAAGGRRLDDAQPYVDTRLPDGTRVHAVLPPLAPDGTCVSLRVPARRSFGIADLEAAGSLTAEMSGWLRAVVAARLAFLVTGGTGSGKTTVLSALLGLVPPGERVLLVEDSGELRPAHPHVVRLEARPANVEGAGAVTLAELVRQALRMRPDRLVVGEVRGGEVVDLLAALNTGHEGGCGTLHANAPAAVPARLEALGVAAGLGREAVHSQVAAGLDAVVHLVREADGSRRVAELHALERDGSGYVVARPALSVDRSGGRRAGPGLESLRAAVEARGVAP